MSKLAIYTRYLKRFYPIQVRLILQRGYASGKKKKTPKKTFSNTISLPSTKFPLWIKSEYRTSLDEKIEKDTEMNSLYEWQKNNVSGPEYILHDGPPYANGSVHIGHAINKIIKDITIRYQLMKGRKINFKPGWDCHGLPIELRALSSEESLNLSPVELRSKARKFTKSTIEDQKTKFKTWGLLADWNECYYTQDKEYVQNQLRRFYDLYEKGLIYRDSRPVYWSPSSRTALAEAELEYNEKHESKAITVRFKVDRSSIPDGLSMADNSEIYALIWTTTPWTLLLNRAIAINEKLNYSLVKIDNTSDIYIIAVDSISRLEASLQNSITIVRNIPIETLKSLKYKRHFEKNDICPFVSATYVRSGTGTGLVHIAPAHGPDDFVLASKFNLTTNCLVDERGCFSDEAPEKFRGLDVLDRGNTTVIEELAENILHIENFQHSYPYDWRTKKPVIFRLSKQWFINVDAIRDAALKCLDNVTIAPKNYTNRLGELIQKRINWCISRQRTWGVPLPFLYKTESDEPVISKLLIEHYCQLIDQHGTDFWWTLPINEIIPKNSEYYDYKLEKGKDILDIWFDSGVSWSYVLGEDQVADLYVEGLDQCRGWFQSSLLTSIGLRNIAPYKNVYIHGFAVDNHGYKMSKSLGNVIEPDDIIKGTKNQQPYGVDVLRWWVACHAVQHHHIPVTENTIRNSHEDVQKLRFLLKFLLGVIDENVPDMASNDKFVLDRYMMHKLFEFHTKMRSFNDKMAYHKLCFMILEFVTNQVSAIYLHCSKDRLYCESKDSPSKKTCQHICFLILEVLLQAIAPIVPHLVEEAFSHHPVYAGARSYFRSKHISPSADWENADAVEKILKVLEIKKQLVLKNGHNLSPFSVTVKASTPVYEILKVFSSNELLDILQVSSVDFRREEDIAEGFEVTSNKTINTACERCRKFNCSNYEILCSRCENIVKGVLSNVD